ncbi:MAG: energy transducer TonB [Acidobacteriota bacterium]
MKKLLSALVCFLLTAPLFATAPDPSVDHRVAQWQQTIERAKESIRAGKYRKADQTLGQTIDEVCNALTGGDEASRMIGLLLTLRALAEAGQDQQTDALWSWHLAQQFEPNLARVDLSEFGSPSELLSQHRIVPTEESEGESDESANEEAQEVREFTPPKVSKAPVKFPRGARWDQQAGQVMVLVTIEEDGALSNPKILESLPNPALTLNALEAMKATWGFKPAEVDGKPVASYYNLQVNYIP